MAPFVFDVACKRKIDLTDSVKYLVHPFSGYLQEPAGREHHQLLANLSKQLPKGSVVYDIGTYMGTSALAFACNPDVTVHTYDIVNNIMWQPTSIRNVPNIVTHIEDGTNAFTADNLKDVKLMLIDVDPHDGKQEKSMIERLLQAGYKGALLLDDIHLNPEMQALWDGIPAALVKHDLTRVGHYSGTGLVLFDVGTVDVSLE
jgi:predicted O-methyltransferase YrrM